MQKRSMNSKGHGMMVALVLLATRGPLRRSEGCAAPTVLRSVRSLLEVNRHPLSIGRVLDGDVLGMVHNQGELSGNRPLHVVGDG